MQFYIVDTTLKPPQERWFPSYPAVVKYLEEMCVREGQPRKQKMILMEEIGYGDDDINSVTFVRAMSEKYNIGILRDGLNRNQKMRCDITSVAMFQKEEYGS